MLKTIQTSDPSDPARQAEARVAGVPGAVCFDVVARSNELRLSPAASAAGKLFQNIEPEQAIEVGLALIDAGMKARYS